MQELYALKDLKRIYPLLVGNLREDEELGKLYGDFFKGQSVPKSPAIAVQSVEDKLKEHMGRAGKPTVSTLTEEDVQVGNVVKAILKFQGVFLRGVASEAVDKAVQNVHELLGGPR